MAKLNGCEIAKKYRDFIKSLLKISLDNNRELGVIFCQKGSDVKPGFTAIGTDVTVELPACPLDSESVGTLHTHIDTDFFSVVDFLSFAAKDDDFSCIAYHGEDGNAYVKCIHRPDDVEKWLDQLGELETLEFEASYAYQMYASALHDVINAIEEEGEMPEGKSELVKVLKERLTDYKDKFDKLRNKAISLEPYSCVVKL